MHITFKIIFLSCIFTLGSNSSILGGVELFKGVEIEEAIFELLRHHGIKVKNIMEKTIDESRKSIVKDGVLSVFIDEGSQAFVEGHGLVNEALSGLHENTIIINELERISLLMKTLGYTDEEESDMYHWTKILWEIGKRASIKLKRDV